MQKSQHTKKYRKLLAALRDAREKARLKQTDVSEKLGAYSTYITKIEAGERRIDVVELADLCQIYGIKLQAFLKSIHLE